MTITQALTESNGETRLSVPNTGLPELVAGILADAVEQGATDIHLDTWGDRGTLRFRVDGVIRERESLAPEQARRLLNQLKVVARLGLQATLRPRGRPRKAPDTDTLA